MSENIHIGQTLLKLHAAVSMEELWTAGVAVLRSEFRFRHALLATLDPEQAPFFFRTSLPVSRQPGYFARLAAAMPLDGVLAQTPGLKTGRMTDSLPPVPIETLPMFSEFMQPEGWRYAAAMFFWSGSQFLGQFAINRSESQGDFTDPEMERLRQLHAHFEVAVNRILSAERERAVHEILAASLKRYPVPIALLDWNLGHLYHNAAAARVSCIREHGEQWLRANKADFVLPVSLRNDLEVFKQEIASATLDAPPLQRRRSRKVNFSHPQNGMLRAEVETVAHGNSALSFPCLIIRFAGVDDQYAGDPNGSMAPLANLTPIELMITEAVAGGASNEAIARRLGISVHTVRAHLRSVFKKSGTTSRGRLAAKFHAFMGMVDARGA